jgi:hypothetical protein
MRKGRKTYFIDDPLHVNASPTSYPGKCSMCPSDEGGRMLVKMTEGGEECNLGKGRTHFIDDPFRISSSLLVSSAASQSPLSWRTLPVR